MFLKLYDFSDYEQYLWEVKNRIELDSFDESQLYTFERGYMGERICYEALKGTRGGVKLWNVRIRSNGEVQFDFLLIKDRFIIHIDVKNFAGPYTFSNNNFVSENNYVNANPLVQLDKAEKKLKYFCYKNNIDYQVKSYVLFINPTFELSGLEHTDKLLYSTDVSRIVKMLGKGEPTNEELYIGELLKKHHHPNSKYERIHYYPFNALKPGMKCPECRKFLPIVSGRQRIVRCDCGYKTPKNKLVLDAFRTIKILKNDAVTTADISRYTGIGKTTIRNVLKSEFETYGKNKGRKYRVKKTVKGIFEASVEYRTSSLDVDKQNISTSSNEDREYIMS
ncbi:NERD domain-containing protein [Macrococcoides goetzii]|nr:nuclease-related domain-containing protein [Macrococcus goetzii]TDM39604.1 NERD domain-containing protein [Macrococcus goetzii]